MWSAGWFSPAVLKLASLGPSMMHSRSGTDGRGSAGTKGEKGCGSAGPLCRKTVCVQTGTQFLSLIEWGCQAALTPSISFSVPPANLSESPIINI